VHAAGLGTGFEQFRREECGNLGVSGAAKAVPVTAKFFAPAALEAVPEEPRIRAMAVIAERGAVYPCNNYSGAAAVIARLLRPSAYLADSLPCSGAGGNLAVFGAYAAALFSFRTFVALGLGCAREEAGFFLSAGPTDVDPLARTTDGTDRAVMAVPGDRPVPRADGTFCCSVRKVVHAGLAKAGAIGPASRDDLVAAAPVTQFSPTLDITTLAAPQAPKDVAQFRFPVAMAAGRWGQWNAVLPELVIEAKERRGSLGGVREPFACMLPALQ
jgi:hypothetical protein